MSARDLENINSTMANYTQAIMIYDKKDIADKKVLDSFLSEMNGVFQFIESLDSEVENADKEKKAPKLFTEKFKPEIMASSLMLIADANHDELSILRGIREILLNRLNSYTKNKKLLYDLSVHYFMQFLNCLQNHANNMIILQQLIMLSAMGMNSQASETLKSFIQGPLAQELYKKKQELARKYENKKESQSFKDNVVK